MVEDSLEGAERRPFSVSIKAGDYREVKLEIGSTIRRNELFFRPGLYELMLTLDAARKLPPITYCFRLGEETAKYLYENGAVSYAEADPECR
jgi:hypothetical protein